MTNEGEVVSTFTVGLVLFDKAAELDWVGPFEVFTMALEIAEGYESAAGIRVVLISEDGSVVCGAKGTRTLVDTSFQDAPPLDLLLIPGGIGTRRDIGWGFGGNRHGALARGPDIRRPPCAQHAARDGIRSRAPLYSRSLNCVWLSSSRD